LWHLASIYRERGEKRREGGLSRENRREKGMRWSEGK